MEAGERKKASSLRWGILRRALLRRSSTDPDDRSESRHEGVSRKATRGFNLIPFRLMEKCPNENLLSSSEANRCGSSSKDVCLRFTLPVSGAPEIYLYQRIDDHVDLHDFEICNRYNIDNTGLVSRWPSEDVLAYYCLHHPDIFRSKNVIELGSGYGLAGLVIAAITEASQVVITDGNPQVVDYIQHNINANYGVFGGTQVKSMLLHWNEGDASDVSNAFDVIVASDCTFFKEFHKGLAQTVKSLLKRVSTSEAIFFSPKRGNSLDKFVAEIEESGLHFSITETYDPNVWRLHEGFLLGNGNWPNYEADHSYPLLVRIYL